MPADMVVALGRSTVDHGTLFAHTSAGSVREPPALTLVAGRSYTPGETVQTQFVRLPQLRQTATVLASQAPGQWGYQHGVNEHGVAIGRTAVVSRLQGLGMGLTGPDLVRLALERAHSAHQAVDLVTDFVERFGQGRFPGCPPQAGDSAFVLADAHEAFVIETAGQHWVCQEIQEVRAVSDVSLVRQDWNRISRGLASHAIEHGWWAADGSKVDFAGAVSDDPVGPQSALRRWGRATMLLEQQSGHIDVAFIRRILSDHYETMHSEVDPFLAGYGPTPLCQHGDNASTLASLVVALEPATGPLTPAWCAFGPPCITVFVPVFLDGELPAVLGSTQPASTGWRVHKLNEQLKNNPRQVPACSEALGRLQARFDQETDEFGREGAVLKQQGRLTELKRQATLFMEHEVEQFLAVVDHLASHERRDVALSQS